MRSMLNRRPAPVRQQPPQSSDGLLLDVRNLKTYFHVMDGVVKAAATTLYVPVANPCS